jgi:hypothetical protein
VSARARSERYRVTTELSEPDLALLREIVVAHAPALIQRLDAGEIRLFGSDEWLDLQLAIANELVDTGLRPDDEPNARGLRLEELLNSVLRACGALPSERS